jgi:chromosome segregation ATPase
MTLSQERQRSQQEIFELEERLQRLHEEELGRTSDLQEANRLLEERQDSIDDRRDADADLHELEHELSQMKRALSRSNSEAAAARAELLEMKVPGAAHGTHTQLHDVTYVLVCVWARKNV